jgi:glycine/D-amino acid oxidase-like deaminating enzyme
MHTINNSLITDIVIIGGGIAGLMLQNKLNALGYSSLLLEQNSLGSGQTIKSQGIIHGGIKYALLGQINEAARAISGLPKIWQDYFNNTSDIDLSATKIIANHHDLWNNGELKNRLKQVLMQKSLSSEGVALNREDYPEIFKTDKFRGSIHRINETVVDTYSLLENLAKNHQNKIIKIDQDSLKIILDNNKHINHLAFTHANQIYYVSAEQYIFTAGQNNKLILESLPNFPSMQLRPLHMVLAKFKEPHVLYGHYVGHGLLPQLTITTHYAKDGDHVWYIGGKLAETGIYLNADQQILQAKVEIKNIFPWLDTKDWEWTTLKVNRAEPLQAGNIRPDHSYCAFSKNAGVAWPIKLTMTPLLIDDIVKNLHKKSIYPKYPQLNNYDFNLSAAKIATPAWEELFQKENVC